MPSPESPANRMTTRSITSGALGRCVVSDKSAPLQHGSLSAMTISPRLKYVAHRAVGADLVTLCARLRSPATPVPEGGYAAERGKPSGRAPARGLGDGDRSVEVDVLDGVEQLAVVHLHDERDPVGVGAGHRPEDPERGGDGVAAALDRQLDDVAGVEVLRVGGKAGCGRVLDAPGRREGSTRTRC